MHPSPPSGFFPWLGLYHILPLHAPLTLFVFDAPFGRFANQSSNKWWWINGNLAWTIMELVAPVTMVCTLAGGPQELLNPQSRILAGAYVVHYIHRAIISPLILSPKRSPIHLIVPIAASAFNLLNANCLAIGLLYFPSSDLDSTRFYFYFSGWAFGLLGNIYHDEVLNDLRRPAGKRLVSSKTDDEEEDKKRSSSGRYAIPRGGLYHLISYPNYFCEWAEWTFYALAASSSLFIPVPPIQSLSLSPSFQNLLRTFEPIWPSKLLHPAWMFVLFEVSAMLPRAMRGHKWYKRTFGERYPAERKVVLPWLL